MKYRRVEVLRVELVYEVELSDGRMVMTTKYKEPREFTADVRWEEMDEEAKLAKTSTAVLEALFRRDVEPYKEK